MNFIKCFIGFFLCMLISSCAKNLRAEEHIKYDSDEVQFEYSNYKMDKEAQLYPQGWRLKLQDSFFTIHSSKVYIVDDSKKNKLFVDTIDNSLYADRINDYQDQQEVHYFSAELISDSIIIINDVKSKGIGLLDVESNEIQYLAYEEAQSVIYKKSAGQWLVATPTYARVTSAGTGYIVKTPRIDIPTAHAETKGMLVYVDSADTALNNVHSEERFIWLNKDLKAISFLDYYDFNNIQDLGFGLQFETDKGAFFVTYEGKVITNDEWDRFEIESGRLVAFREVDLDPSKENYIDKTGSEIAVEAEEIQYFDF